MSSRAADRAGAPPAHELYLPFTRPIIDEATIETVAEVLRSGWITTGPKARAFEAVLSEYFGGRPVRALASGTGALELALEVAGIAPGDEVITTPLSWVATANVVVRAGARPVFVDIDPATRNIDLALAERAITSRTRAILPVDLAGLPVDRGALYALARRHSIRVIEDAAQSMGATWNGRRIGSFGDLVAISFHPNKNMTTTEGGCLVVNDESEATLVERLRLQGVQRLPDGEQEVERAGAKHNLTDVAAAIGLGQLAHLEAFNVRRRARAPRELERFDRTLGCGLTHEESLGSNRHNFHIQLPHKAM
jgi:dTDP-4-amino-4,6-dideoxygalactose transaminase